MRVNAIRIICIPIFLLLMFFTSCDFSYTSEKDDIDGLIIATPNLPEAPPVQSPKIKSSSDTTLNSNGVSYMCTTRKYSYANNMEDVIAFNPNAGTLYPGALVQGKYVRRGQLVSIGDHISRSPLTITFDNYGLSTSILAPSNATITNGILELLDQNDIETIAKISFKKTESYTTDQGLLSLGIDKGITGGNLGVDFNTNNTQLTRTIYVRFMQEYYTVSINQPSKPSNFFGGDVLSSDLNGKVSDDNPLCYVSSVTYGRFILAKITTTEDVEDVKTGLDLAFGSIQGNTSFTASSTLRNSDIEVYIIGGNAGDATTAATGGIEGIVEYIKNGANFTTESVGTPISYVVKHASNNETVKLGRTLEYNVNENCYCNEDEIQRFQIYIDGFDIGGDCDDGWEFDGGEGAGEFTYDLGIYNGDELIRRVSNSTEAEKHSGEFLSVSAGPYDFYVGKTENQDIQIKGSLYEDDSGDITNLSWNDIVMTYPWTDIADTATYFAQPIDNGTSCNATLYYWIKKVE